MFSVISRTQVVGWGSYPSAEMQSVYSISQTDFGVGCRDSTLSFHYRFLLNIVIKIRFFVTCHDISSKQVILLSWKKTCRYGYVIFLMFFPNRISNSNAQLAYFSYLFQVSADCVLGYVEFKREFSSTFVQIAFPPILLKTCCYGYVIVFILQRVWRTQMPI